MLIDLNAQKEGLHSQTTLSLRDFEHRNQNDDESEYLSLSVARLDGLTYIRITTVGAQPITYMAIIRNTEDLASVQFEMQAK